MLFVAGSTLFHARREAVAIFFQRLGRNFPERIQAIHRERDAPEVLPHWHKVEYAPKVDSQQILSFYMGKNTSERMDDIMENLVVMVEE